MTPERTGLRPLLEVVVPHLGPALAGPAAVDEVRRLACALPLVDRAGFESRLGPRARPTVDLQAGFAVDEASRVAAALDRAGDGPWRAVRDVCRSWADGGLDRRITELWLEVDADGAGEPSPSIFAVLAGAGGSAHVDVALDLVRTLLPPDRQPATEQLVRTLSEGVGGRGVVNHVGLMLGRPVTGVRLHVSAVALRDVADVARDVGWPGDVQELETWAHRLLDLGDRLALCFEAVDGRLTPRIGLECFFTQLRGVDPRWPALLRELAAHGLCTDEQADALLGWPGYGGPFDADPWPDELVQRDIGGSPETLVVVERRLSHVKVTIGDGDGDGAATAKAYFGFGRVALDLAPAPPPAPTRRPVRERPLEATESTRAGLDLLLQRRNQAGWWRDFFDRARPADVEGRVTGYASDEWVTAFVAHAVAGATGADAADGHRAALEAHRLLHRRRATGGWGYHALLPADADTSTWVLRLGLRLGLPPGRRDDEALELVRALTTDRGGVRTYPGSAAAPLAEFLRMEGDYAGWCAEHLCVTAAAAGLDGMAASRGLLRATQRADGSWTGHWWEDDEYTTARAVEALWDDPAPCAAAHAWATGRVDGPSPFAVALALTVIARTSTGPLPQAGVRARRRLLAMQRTDGSWEPSARLRVPAPDAVDPTVDEGRTRDYVDDDALFTTATVLEALWRSGPTAAPSRSGGRPAGRPR